MHEILAALPSTARVLDLGSGLGSFDAREFGFTVIRADLEASPAARGAFVMCSASALPFARGSFHALILNHSFEHFENLSACVSEIARVLGPAAHLYIAVPDASTFTDRVYRWIGRGGGHVNLFTDADAAPRMITAATGLRHAGTRVLCTSLSFLNRKNIRTRLPGKLLLFGNGQERFLRVLTFALRRLDRWFHWRTSVYGWAFYFGDGLTIDPESWSNVCVRCGSGNPSVLLESTGKVIRRRLLPSMYVCSICGTRNFFTEDEGRRR